MAHADPSTDHSPSASAVSPRGSSPHVSILIPVYNQLALTRQCLEALFTAASTTTRDVWVVNNGSTDGTRAYLDSMANRVHAIHRPENIGFAAACNQGAQAAHGRLLVFLNNDTVPHDGWLDALVSEADAMPDIGAVGAKLLYPNGRVQHAGLAFGPHVFPYHIYRSADPAAPFVSRRRELQALTGACLLVPRGLFLELGGFDTQFVNGLEDVDLCLRLGERGKRVVYCPQSVVTHYEGMTAGRRQAATSLGNLQRFVARWGQRVRCDDIALCLEDGTDLDEVRREDWARQLVEQFPEWFTARGQPSRPRRSAVERAQVAISQGPTSAAAWDALGVALRQAGQPAAARIAWQRALALDPSHHNAQRHLAEGTQETIPAQDR